MDDFLKFFDEQVITYPMHLQICYSQIGQWGIKIFKKGANSDGTDLNIFDEWGEPNAEYIFAKAYIALHNHLMEYCGGC